VHVARGDKALDLEQVVGAEVGVRVCFFVF
jgi:hypothetical protein